MLYVLDDGTIRLTRGDTARFTVPITNETNGEEYTMQSGDILQLTVKKVAKTMSLLFKSQQKVLTLSRLILQTPKSCPSTSINMMFS